MNGAPSWLIELLKKLSAGLVAFESAVPLSRKLSPVKPRSPSNATTPSRVFTVPAGGVTNPLTVMLTVVVPETSAKPSNTTRLRAGCVASEYTTTSDQPPCTFVVLGVERTSATRYTPAPAARTSAVTSAKPW